MSTVTIPIVDDENKPTTFISKFRAAADGGGSFFRVAVVLAFIWIFFGVANPLFLSPGNLTNLSMQIAAVGIVSIGVILILLLAEIDLSVGSVSGMCAAITGTLSAIHGWPAWAAILAGIFAGAVVGLFQGFIVTWLSIPSFIVTLAGLLGFAGVQLAVIGSAGTISITDPAILGLANAFMPYWLSWAFSIIAIAALLGGTIVGRRRRVEAGVEVNSLTQMLIGPIVIAILVLAGTGMLNYTRGVPVSLAILVALVFSFSILVNQTTYGRHVLAVGGNNEAARRVGIATSRVKIIVFVLGSSLAAVGGVLAMARLYSVDASAGSGNFLLYAIAGPVIAGVSLFGGRGSVWAALLGAIVIGSIQNGMNLLSFPAWAQAIVTALVLLVAVVLDALARHKRNRRA